MPPHEPPRPAHDWLRRLMWFVALWAAGVAAVGALAFLIRRVML